MKKQFFFIALLIPLLSIADEYPADLSRLSIKGGPNYSLFINDDNSEVFNGFTFGLSYDYYIKKKLLITFGLYYTKEGGILKDKITRTIHLWDSPIDTSYSYTDIQAAAGYIKIPLTYGYPVFYNKKREMTVYGGLAFLLPIKDYTTKEGKEDIEEKNNINYEYESLGIDAVFDFGDNTNFTLEFGCVLRYKQIMIDLNMNYQLKDFGKFDNISKIEKNLLSFKILFGILFK